MTIDIERLKQLCAAAAPGPWGYDDGEAGRYFPSVRFLPSNPEHPWAGKITINEPSPGKRSDYEATAQFIAAARESVPALIAEVERLTDAKLYGEKVCAQLVAQRDAALAKSDWWEKHAKMMARAADTEKAEAAEMRKQRDAAIVRVGEIERGRDEALAAVRGSWQGLAPTLREVAERDTAERIAQLADDRATELTRCPNPYHEDVNDRNDAKADELRNFAADIRTGAWRGAK